MRVFVWPWFFRLPYLRRFDGYAGWNTIVLRLPLGDEDLLTHELCHVWQIQPGQMREDIARRVDQLTRPHLYYGVYQLIGGRDALLQLQPFPKG